MKHAVSAQGDMPGWYIRTANPGDVARLVCLCEQLGYPIEHDQLSQQLSIILDRTDHAIFIATNPDGHVLGWLHIFEQPLLMQTTGAELGGLVVDEEAHRQGMGRALLGAAEGWVQERGLAHLTVRSNISRVGAHAFYQALEYEHIKTAHVFKKAFRA